MIETIPSYGDEGNDSAVAPCGKQSTPFTFVRYFNLAFSDWILLHLELELQAS